MASYSACSGQPPDETSTKETGIDTKVNPTGSAFNSHLQWLKTNIVVIFTAKCESGEQDETKQPDSSIQIGKNKI